MPNLSVYIDGFNLYHAIDKLHDAELKWLNLWKVAETLLRQDETLTHVHFFTAVWPYDASKQKRHQNFNAAQRASGVTVHEGKFSKPQRWCDRHQRRCPFREEKQTDVGIAVKMICDAATGAADRMILVTADSDQIPTARALNAMPDVRLRLAFPPGRSKEARELGNYIPDRRELTPGRLKTCKLPRTVIFDGAVVATMPAIYAV